MGKPVLIGRKTYLSIGRPLKGRTTIVVSRDPTFTAAGIVVAPSLDAGLAAARGDALRRGTDTIVIAGGADIYAQALPLAAGLVITEVHKSSRRAIAQFPAIDPRIWREIARSGTKACSRRRGSIRFRHLPYVRPTRRRLAANRARA